ncbi:MAG: hypothetical protein IJU41_06545, partial [Clostridia bacterium]|nr:hypothetical protein [Clostridia bacterium]
MKRFFICFCILLLTVVCLSFAVTATENVVYLAAGGSGDGSTALTPLGSLGAAFTALGDDGGTIVLCSDLPIGAVTNLPAHTGTVRVTSLYNDVDYRTANNASLRFTASCRLVLGGPTSFDDFVFEIDQGANSGAVIAANFHPLYIGYNVAVVHNYAAASSRLFIVGGSNNDAAGNGLAAGQSSSVEIYSGNYMQLTAFSRGTANKA